MMFLTLIILQISLICALPTKQLKYSLIVDRPYHPFNFESVLFSESSLFLNPEESDLDNDWFLADLDITSGIFHQAKNQNFVLAINDKNGLLSLKSNQKLDALTKREAEDPQESKDDVDPLTNNIDESSIFSIKHGVLYHNGLNDFSLCCSDIAKQTYSIYQTSKIKDKTCVNRIDSIRLRVLNQLGIHADDFEAPEFLYQTGKKLL